MKKYFIALLFLSSVMMAINSTRLLHRKDSRRSVPLLAGCRGGRACAYPFVRIVLGEVADGNVITTGYMREIDGTRYLFMNKDSAFARNLSERIKIESINDEACAAIPGMFRDRMVKAVGTLLKEEREARIIFICYCGKYCDCFNSILFSDERA